VIFPSHHGVKCVNLWHQRDEVALVLFLGTTLFCA